MDEDKSNMSADQPETPEGEQSTPDKKSRFRFGNKKLWLVILPLILLAGGLLWATYQYNQSASRADELSEEVALLQQAVADKDEQLGQLAPAEAGEQTEPGASQDCSGGASYNADVGKFTVQLNDPYVIVRDLDAAFEGGPATRLSIASCIDGENNVVDSPYQREVSILANPQASAADLKTSFESNTGALTAAGTVDVDGVTADKYTFSGLFEVNVLFFERDGIGYQIEASGTPAEFNPLLSDITDDWEFDS